MASEHSAAPNSNILTPVRQLLRKLAGKSTVLDDLKEFIEQTESYSSLMAQSVTAEIEFNSLRNFLVFSRKVKGYDPKIGPYDTIKLVVKEDGCYVFKASIGYDFNRVVIVNFPPNSVRDSEGTVLYQCTSIKKGHLSVSSVVP